MDEIWKRALWNQFAATIDMLRNALERCPGGLWTTPLWKDPLVGTKYSEFWYVAYHALFWLDLYLTGSVDGFTPPSPFNLDELDPSGLLPPRVYRKDELLTYLSHCRQKCCSIIDSLTAERLTGVSFFPWRKEGIDYAELLLDNMRHVQEHAAQLNMFLGQHAGLPANWLAQPCEDERK